MKNESSLSIMQRHAERSMAEAIANPWTHLPTWVKLFESSVPTYLENWPEALKALSIPQVQVPLSIEQAKDLGSNIWELGEAFREKPADLDYLKAPIENAIQQLGGRAFVRLGSRSPKDGYCELGQPALDAQHAIWLLTAGSERVADDLQLAIAHNYAPSIFLRQWRDIPEWAEFRCFMKCRKLVGISQYLFLDFYQAITDHAASIVRRISDWFPQFEAACHLGDVVFDVFLEDDAVRLLEINPYGQFTDPCMFRCDPASIASSQFRYRCRPMTEEERWSGQPGDSVTILPLG